MTGSGGTEVLAHEPDHDGRTGKRWTARPQWLVPVLTLAAGVAIGLVGAHLVGADGVASTTGQPAVSASPAAGHGIVTPEVVEAQTLPGTGGMEVVATGVQGGSTPGSLRYDYSLNGAVWLQEDGTVRTGRPACFLNGGGMGLDDPQYLQVAVVHARAVAGGPIADRVVWYRCATGLPAPSG